LPTVSGTVITLWPGVISHSTPLRRAVSSRSRLVLTRASHLARPCVQDGRCGTPPERPRIAASHSTRALPTWIEAGGANLSFLERALWRRRVRLAPLRSKGTTLAPLRGSNRPGPAGAGLVAQPLGHLPRSGHFARFRERAWPNNGESRLRRRSRPLTGPSPPA
jgi:hypothetical protein